MLAGKVDLASATGIGVALATIAGPLALFPRTRCLGFAGLAVAELATITESFPWSGNHRYYELVLCLLASLLDVRVAEERRVLLRCVQWLTAIVLFYSGAQKLAHGFYTSGHYLSYLAHEETFQPILRLLAPAAEVTRVAALPRTVGTGPYLLPGPRIVVASNVVYLAEMGLAVLLVWRRARGLAVAGTLLLLCGIELGARELFFGLLFTNAVLTFAPRPVAARAWPVFVAICLGALLVRAGWLPEVTFH